MAEAVTPPASPAPPERSRHAPTFALLTGALVGVALGAIALAFVLASGGRAGGPPTDWALWAPTSGAGSTAQQIANHVAPEYRADDGRQLAAVTGGQLEFAKLPGHVAVRSLSGDISVVDGSSTLFTVCGGGLDCSFAEGKPSNARLLLLQREALELALYTFQYTKVDNVVALLPPPSKAKASKTSKTTAAATTAKPTTAMALLPPNGTALVFRRDQLSTALKEPLDDTLPPQVPTIATVAKAPETVLVRAMTDPSLFLVDSIVKGQDASAFLVLDASS
jgi:hypothetical protein